jgi:hypothetical protein
MLVSVWHGGLAKCHAVQPLYGICTRSSKHVVHVVLGCCRYLYEIAPTKWRCLVVAFGWSGVVSVHSSAAAAAAIKKVLTPASLSGIQIRQCTIVRV